MANDGESPPTASLIGAITAALSASDADGLATLHDLLAEHNAIDTADELVRALRMFDPPADELVHALGTLNPPARDLRSLARWLVEHGTRRNAVALGIVMLGIVDDPRDRELLLLLGTFDDLTMYTVIALANSQQDLERSIYSLARRVDGWGRIYTVERLRGTQDPEIKSWMLRGGFRNSVLNQYLTYIAATTGDLYTALLAPEVDPELLDGAAGILESLVDLHGPTSDIRQYADALPCLARFGELIASTPPNLTYIDTAQQIAALLKEPPPVQNWPEADIARLLDQYSRLLALPEWSQRVRLALDHPATEFEFRVGLACSEAVGIDALPHAMSRLRRPPYDHWIWHWVVTHTSDHEHADLVRLAGRVLPLDEMVALGPDPERIIGSSDGESVLDTVLSFTSQSSVPAADVLPLIRAALRGQGLRMRGIGLRALKSLYAQDLPATPRAWIREAAMVEPDDGLREKFADMLKRTGMADEH